VIVGDTEGEVTVYYLKNLPPSHKNQVSSYFSLKHERKCENINPNRKTLV